MRRTACLPALALAALAALTPAPRPAPGCTPVAREGEGVAITEESALIVWDAERKTEHFIRRARFATDAPDFGFLVPTPTRPQLAEVPDDVFSDLEDWTKPEVVVQEVRVPRSADVTTSYTKHTVGRVEVLERRRLAGQEVAVLRADDAQALADWLTKNGYHGRPALTAWLRRYVEAQWVLTAFKVAKKTPEASGASLAAVRMTFQTDRPFYPYREPADPRPDPSFVLRRMLRVFFVGDARVRGTLGDRGAWPGQTAWANRLDGGRREALRAKLKLGGAELPADAWLTVFDDPSSPRVATDEVFFARAADQRTVARPPEVHYSYVGEPAGPQPWGWRPWAQVGLALAGSGVLVLFCLLAWRHPAR